MEVDGVAEELKPFRSGLVDKGACFVEAEPLVVLVTTFCWLVTLMPLGKRRFVVEWIMGVFGLLVAGGTVGVEVELDDTLFVVTVAPPTYVLLLLEGTLVPFLRARSLASRRSVSSSAGRKGLLE